MKVTAPLRIDLAGGWTDVDAYATRWGGAVVNVAINHRVVGEKRLTRSGAVGVTYRCDLPTGSGLGTSGALNVAWCSLISGKSDPAKVAEMAFDVECALGTIGGRQDQYAAAFGGLNVMRFGGGSNVAVQPVQCPCVEELESRLVLCYTGCSRSSSRIHEDVWNAYGRNDMGVANALHYLAAIGKQMSKCLEKGDLLAVGKLMLANWHQQKALHPSVTTPELDAVFDAAISAGAIGGKAVGAGGGGCLVFLADENQSKSVASAVAAAGASVIDFKFDFDGVMSAEE